MHNKFKRLDYLLEYLISTLRKSVQHLSLHSMLQLASADHSMNNFQYGSFRIFLTQEILYYILLGHLRTDSEASLQLFFYS